MINIFYIGDEDGGSWHTSTTETIKLCDEASVQSRQWTEWSKELKIYFEAAGITAGKRKRAQLLYLGGEVLRDISESYEDTEKTFESTFIVVNGHFEQKDLNSTVQRQTLQKGFYLIWPDWKNWHALVILIITLQGTLLFIITFAHVVQTQWNANFSVMKVWT